MGRIWNRLTPIVVESSLGCLSQPDLDRSHVMKTLINTAKRFVESEDGPTATEYAVMLSLIIVACIVTVGTLGTKVDMLFADADAKIGA
jgi:pilus assembly protein Flp/PilA